MSDVKDLQNRIVNFRDDRDWKQFHNPKDMAISLMLEAAELLEHFQWKSPDEVNTHLKDNLEDVSDELADILYWVLLMAHDLKIDILDVSNKKLQKNSEKYPLVKAMGNHKKYTELR